MTVRLLELTAAQLGVWAAEQVSPDADAFRISQLVWLDDDVDVAALNRALAVAGSEAEVLGVRPTIGSDGVPRLAAAGRPIGALQVVTSACEDAGIRAVAAERCRVDGVGQNRYESLSVLHPRTSGGWAWEFATHHLFVDAYALGLFTRRVAEVYSALVTESAVPDRWFGDYAELVSTAASPQDSISNEFWVERCAEAEGAPAVTFDASRRFSLPFTHGRASIAPPTAEAIDALARSARASWSDVVALGWGLFTAARDGRDLFALQLPRMNRFGAAALRTPAMLVDAAPVVFRVDPSNTLVQLTTRMRDEMRASSRHHTAGEALARLWPNGQDDYAALPQLNVKAFDYDYAFGSIIGRQETVTSGPAGRLDLMVYRDRIHGFRLDLSSNDPAHTPDSLTDMLDHFLGYLTRIAESTNDAVANVGLLSTEQFDRVDALSTGPVVARDDATATLDIRVRQRISATPDAVALVDDAGVALTYRQFDARVNAMAAEMLSHGVTSGDRVAVMLPRSVDLVLTLHAVIRIGAAYVPVDVDYPSDRIGHILDDAAPILVIADLAGSSRHSAVLSETVVAVDDPLVRARLDTSDTAVVVASPPSPSDAAYVIFTSGTTGRPKGVMVSHRAIVNRLQWMRDDYALTPSDRVLQKTPAVFDVSVWEFFLPFVIGASLIIARDQGHKDPGYLVDVIERHSITVAHFVPAMLQAFLDATPEVARLSSMRRVFFSGEALPAKAAEAAATLFAAAELHNLYGPTEAAVDVTAQQVDSPQSIDNAAVPIGRPVANTVVRVLDSWLRPIPDGVVGELYLGGVQLADGYIGRPDLTASRFVASPAGERLYRTGDLVRWNASGVLEYLGRTDDQVKIRGFRIELDEIRVVLERHASVSAAVVLAVDHPAGGHFLAAYHTGDAVDADELRQFVAAALPDYMVPTVFLPLDSLPTTPNGKLDRRALPAPELATSGTRRAPVTPAEHSVARYFCDVLALPQSTDLSTDDDFFHLGGHSLSATRLVARVNAEFGSALTLRDVFDARTVARLATLVGVSQTRESISDIVVPERVPASFGQQSLWVIDRLGGPRSQYVVPNVVRLTGDLDVAAAIESVRDVVRRHEPLRTRLVEWDGDPIQVIVPAEAAAASAHIAVADLRTESAEGIDSRIDEVVGTGFDLYTDLPIRVEILRTAERAWTLVFAIHHHAVDEWSLPSLFRDLSRSYAARVVGDAPAWEPLPVSYAQYATWQRTVLGSAADPTSELSRHVDYWRGALDDAPAESIIALDRPRPTQPTYRGRDVTFELDRHVVAGLHRTATDLGVTMFTVAHAATALTASLLGAGTDVVIGSPVGGRTEDGLEDLVGYFVNTLPFRHTLDPHHTVAEVLAQVHRTVLDGFAHQSAPFEDIARALDVPRVTGRTPLFQILLSHHTGVGSTGPELVGLVVDDSGSIRATSSTATKTDLEFDLEESSDGITGYLTYAVDLFSPSTIDRFVRTFIRVVQTFADAPSSRVSALVCDTDTGSIDEWSTGSDATGLEIATAGATLDSLVRNQIQATPDAIALVDDTGTALTYAQFDTRIDAMTAVLLDTGVRRGDRVAVILPRSIDLAAALHATVRLGAAYVPIDPNYPTERVGHILDDATPTTIVTDRTTLENHRSTLDDDVIVIDRADTRLTLDSVASVHVPSPPAPGDTAYVIFTSGTTGRPKGVMVSHAAIVNLIAWRQSVFTLDIGDRVLQKTSVGFDVSVPEFFWPLTVGATIRLIRPDGEKDPDHLAHILRDEPIAFVELVPTVLHAMLDTGFTLADTQLRSLSVGGEAFPTALARELVGTDVHVWNTYGPTEAAVEVTGHHLQEDTVNEYATGTVPIGGPVTATTVHVLDPWLRPVPIGVTGELYLGGIQLADGYITRPGLTATRFTATTNGQRLYRTGDLARWNTGGQLDYLGRTDDQIKIRGFRIELDDIRTTLEQHPAVTTAIVVALDHPASGTILAAYYTGHPAADLRTHTATALPDYMVPTTYTHCESSLLSTATRMGRSVARSNPVRTREPMLSSMPRRSLSRRSFTSRVIRAAASAGGTITCTGTPSRSTRRVRRVACRSTTSCTAAVKAVVSR
nr:non-ribosomal peptide synthetase [Rhodococcus sp. 02-925g]